MTMTQIPKWLTSRHAQPALAPVTHAYCLRQVASPRWQRRPPPGTW